MCAIIARSLKHIGLQLSRTMKERTVEEEEKRGFVFSLYSAAVGRPISTERKLALGEGGNL